MTDFLSGKTPIHEDYFAVRNHVGLIDLSSRGKIEVTGKDRVSFLQGMVTNDVKKLKAGTGLHTALLDSEAHILADFHLFAFEDRFLIDCRTALTQKILDLLGRYLITEDVSLNNRSESLAWLGVEGPEAETLVQKIAGEEFDFLKPFTFRNAKIGDISAEIFRLSLTGEDGFYFLAANENKKRLSELLLTEGKPYGIGRFDKLTLEELRIEAGIPLYDKDMDDKTLFSETGLNDALSTAKGCFLGQEALARLMAEGEPRKKLSGFEILSGSLPETRSAVLLDEEKIGFITSAVYSPALRKNIAIGYLRSDVAGSKSHKYVDIENGGSPMKALIYPLPFVSFRRI